METLVQDIRYAVRTLRRNPGFTAVALLALALGIGANTAVFSIVDGVLLRPLPYPRADRVLALHNTWAEGRFHVSERERLIYAAETGIFAEFAALQYGALNLTGEGEPERVAAAGVNANLLPLLGVRPALGRNFSPREDRPGRDDVVILSHELWQRRFGGAPDVIGRRVELGGTSRRVVGVLPAGFRLPADYRGGPPVQVLVPLALDPSPDPRNLHYLDALSLLAPGVELEQARAAMRTVAARVKSEIETLPATYSVELLPIREEILGDVRPALLILLGAVGLVLLIACANVANLLLARAESRNREIAIRSALGAGRRRLARQVMTESVVLALAGGALGLLLAVWGTGALVGLSPPELPRVQEIGPDLRVLAFTAAVSLLTGIAFGLVPAVAATPAAIGSALREAGRGGSARSRTRRVLVIAEVALAVGLAVGAGLMIRSFVNLHAVDPGFQPERVLTFRLSLPSGEYADKGSARRYYDRALERLRGLPGVAAAGASSHLPLNSDPGDWGVIIEGRPRPGPQEQRGPNADWMVVTDGYFESMGIPVQQGRTFRPTDRASARPVVVINEAMARAYWPDRSPIGERFRFTTDIDTVYRTIIGVVGNVRHLSLEAEPQRQMYLPHAQFPETASWAVGSMTLAVRAAGDPAALTGAIRRELQALDPDVPMARVQMMEQVLASATSVPRMYLILFGTFATLALALVSVGVYGVVAYTVARRTRELGIRIALGADARRVLALVLREGMMLAVIGLAIGLGAAFVLARVVRALLFRVSATDPATFLVVAAAVLLVAFLANYLPARRATRVDPLLALRAE